MRANESKDALVYSQNDCRDAFYFGIRLISSVRKKHTKTRKERDKEIIEVLFRSGVFADVHYNIDDSLLSGAFEKVHHVETEASDATCQNCIGILQ